MAAAHLLVGYKRLYNRFLNFENKQLKSKYNKFPPPPLPPPQQPNKKHHHNTKIQAGQILCPSAPYI